MKQNFKSKKSSIFIVIVAALFLLRIITSLNNFTRDDASSRTWEYSGDVFEVLLITVIFATLIFRSANIENSTLKIRGVFSVKKIDINTIRALKTIQKNSFIYGDTQVIIQYNKFDDFMFNPADKEAFIQAVLAIKPDIAIIKG